MGDRLDMRTDGGESRLHDWRVGWSVRPGDAVDGEENKVAMGCNHKKVGGWMKLWKAMEKGDIEEASRGLTSGQSVAGSLPGVASISDIIPQTPAGPSSRLPYIIRRIAVPGCLQQLKPISFSSRKLQYIILFLFPSPHVQETLPVSNPSASHIFSSIIS